MIARIRERDTFVRLRRDGVRLRNDPLWCAYLHDPAMTPPRVGFAIGRTVGSAVTRNRLRRRLRALLEGTDLPPGALLVGASPRVNELTFAQLRARTLGLVDSIRRQAVAATPPGAGGGR